MALRVAINGFGRMGRLGLRAAWGRWPHLEFVHVNEILGDAACAAHLLKYDSVHGRWNHDVSADGNQIVIDGKRLGYSMVASPAQIDWRALGVDLVLECTGRFKTMAALQTYLDQGVKKVVVACPVKEEAALNVVMGVNDHQYDPVRHNVVTAASCTTNCLAPVVKVILESLGIRRGSMTTIHNITNTQTIIDLGHKDLRRARANSLSLIPTSTGSARAIIQIFPQLKGKIDGTAVRVPLLNASLTDMVFEVERPTTVAEVNGLLKAAAEGPLKGILGYEELPLVSIDYNNDERSSIVDALSTMVIDGTHVKIMSWYDNEVGYANRMVELAQKVAVMMG
ncbi:MAG: ArsJ-associated glyceraldehyde-3-phosphate dehydrogenase [Magnetococcales bacterium]|nr:ArsJ-associated glyceraldehyde-3-phosphate dehydrogenase [Magnetococcales bacterium]